MIEIETDTGTDTHTGKHSGTYILYIHVYCSATEGCEGLYIHTYIHTHIYIYCSATEGCESL